MLLSEDSRLQAILRTFGIETQTPEEVAPVRVRSPEILRKIYALLGKDEKLALSGRPDRPIGSLGTCKLYRIDSDLYAFTPSFMQATGFYLTQGQYPFSSLSLSLSFVLSHCLSLAL